MTIYQGKQSLYCPCYRCKEHPTEPKESILEILGAIVKHSDEYDMGILLDVTSGVRCPAHNQDIGGEEDSRHIHADAVDLACSDSCSRYRIVSRAIAAGATFVEICPRHVHIDTRPTSLRRVVLGEDK